MDTGSILIGIIMILFSLLPFILISKSRKKIKKQFTNALKANEKYNTLKITNSEFAGHFMIGIDENKRQLFYINKKSDNFEVDVIDLSVFSFCSLIKTFSTNQLDQENRRINLVELRFIDSNNNHHNIELYNEKDTQNLDGELQIGQKWEKTINDLILI